MPKKPDEPHIRFGAKKARIVTPFLMAEIPMWMKERCCMANAVPKLLACGERFRDAWRIYCEGVVNSLVEDQKRTAKLYRAHVTSALTWSLYINTPTYWTDKSPEQKALFAVLRMIDGAVWMDLGGYLMKQ